MRSRIEKAVELLLTRTEQVLEGGAIWARAEQLAQLAGTLAIVDSLSKSAETQRKLADLADKMRKSIEKTSGPEN